MQLANYISNTFRQSLLAFVLTVFCCNVASGQAVAGWEKYYGEDNLSIAYDCIQGEDEGLIIVGEKPFNNAYITRTTPDGIIRWEKSFDIIEPLAFGFKAIAKADEGYVAAGFGEGFGTGGSKDIFVVQINNEGDTIWTNNYGFGEDDEANDIIRTSDGGFAIIGYTESSNGDNDIYLLKINSLGDTIWTKQFGTPEFDDEGLAIIEVANGDLVATGSYGISDNTTQTLLLRTTSGGELIWFEGVQLGGNVGNDIIEAIDDGFIIAGRIDITVGAAIKTDGIITKINTNGSFDWANAYGNQLQDETDEFTSVVRSRDGGYVLAGITEVSDFDIQAYLVKTNAFGFLDGIGWEKSFGKNGNFETEQFNSIINTTDGGYYMVGSYAQNALDLIQSFYSVKTKAQGVVYSDYITGNVFFDVDGSNDFTTGDQPIEGWIVEAISDEHTCFGTSQADGSYSILVDTGMYDIIVRRPNDYWSSPSTIGFNIPNPDDTFDINFAVQDLEICTDLEVDISTAALTPGEDADYKLLLCNDGTTTATDPFIEVTYDEAFTINGITGATFSVNGNVLTIDPQMDLAPFACHEMIIRATLDGGLVEGETHSMKAHAFPDEICTGGGDGSHLEVRAECVGNNVNLIIKNTGIQAMSSASDFVIIEDMVLLSSPEPITPLQPNEELIIPRAANGSTYRICANQTPGHPGDSRPTTAIEGCVAGGGSFSTGFVNTFSEDDYDHFLSVDCQENVNVLSPNESRGYPKGYNSATDSQLKNEISPCIDLKYIHRFQNTGPDTAIRVVIQDTLSRFLDPASVRPGASSHDYRMEVYGCGILRFTFDNIFLPGSSTDPQASQVFVKYRVSQRPSNPAGAIVDNSAAAYFDYKASVTTDSIYHTIADDCPKESYVDIDTTSHAIYLEEVEDVNIFPNPFQDEMTVEIIGEVQLNNAHFIVYDLRGRLVRREAFTGKTFTFNRNNMTSGMYVYLIESEGQMVSTGKIIVN